VETRRIGIVLNGVTGRMGTNQHLVRSILAIMQQGGVQVSPELTLMPDPILTGRNENKLQSLAEQFGPAVTGKPLAYTTDVEAAARDDAYEIFFDASGTTLREKFVDMGIAGGKAIYCEKPTATTAEAAFAMADRVEQAGLKNGVVQDKLWLPGLRKLQTLIEMGFFGRILSVHGDFGYWVFSGKVGDQPAQRPSWNYRSEDGGGIMLDMFCHWQYVIENLFGPIGKLVAWGSRDLPQRVDEAGRTYDATADDSAYAMFVLRDGTVCQFNSSWCTRVRRDDLLTIQVDSENSSAVAGLRECRVQSMAETPRPIWNPDVDQPINFYEGWQLMPNTCEYDNAFKAQWELFLRHVALDEPFAWSLRAGARGVELAELGMKSWAEQAWMTVPQ
jgi:predicted dehydrogenase